MLKFPKIRSWSFPCLGLKRRNCEQSIGMRVSAPIVDTIMMILVIHPNCLNMRPAIPLIIVNGRNPASMVNVEAITEIPTSWVACTAASFGFAPLSRCVEMFSSTTMASSTTIPIAIESDDIETMFNVFPVAQRYINDARREIGMERTMMNVEIADWLKYFKHASYVITDSFHGFCYSIIFERNMSVFPNKLRGLSRFESISKLAGLEDRLFYSKEEMIQKEPWLTPVDYDQVHEKMQPEIEFSRKWLKDALKMEKCPPSKKELELWNLLEAREKLNKLDQENKKLQEQIAAMNGSQKQEIAVPKHRKGMSVKQLVKTVLTKIKNLLRKIKHKFLH